MLDLNSDYVGVNILVNNSILLSFFNVYVPFIRSLTDSRTDSFSPILTSFRNLFWGTLIAITFSGTEKVLPTPVGKKYSIGSFLLCSSLSMILTYILFSIAPLAVAGMTLPINFTLTILLQRNAHLFLFPLLLLSLLL